MSSVKKQARKEFFENIKELREKVDWMDVKVDIKRAGLDLSKDYFQLTDEELKKLDKIAKDNKYKGSGGQKNRLRAFWDKIVNMKEDNTMSNSTGLYTTNIPNDKKNQKEKSGNNLAKEIKKANPSLNSKEIQDIINMIMKNKKESNNDYLTSLQELYEKSETQKKFDDRKPGDQLKFLVREIETRVKNGAKKPEAIESVLNKYAPKDRQKKFFRQKIMDKIGSDE